jgi:hypothetical protein
MEYGDLMKNPVRHTIVMAWWDAPMSRWTKAKWTGKRWMRFNELFGGFDPITILPSKWKTIKEWSLDEISSSK